MSRSAFVRPDYRDGFRTLDAILAAPKLLLYTAIAIDAPAQQLLYQQWPACPYEAGVGVQNVALPLDGLSKLRESATGTEDAPRVRQGRAPLHASSGEGIHAQRRR